MRVVVGDIRTAIDKLYARGLRFGQNFIFLRGGLHRYGDRDVLCDGVQEKVDRLRAGDNTMMGPALNSKNTICEGHHIIVALEILGMLTDEDVDGCKVWGAYPCKTYSRGEIKVYDSASNVIAMV